VTSGRGPSKPRRKAVTRTDRRRAAVDRRRAFAQQATQRAARYEARRRRRRWLLAGSVIAALLLIAGVVSYFALRGSSGSTTYALTGSTVPAPATPFSITTPPAAYSLTYKLDTFGTSNAVSTEQIAVSRPFNGKVVSKNGAPPGTTEQWSATSNLGLYADTTSGGSPEVLENAPQAALGDFRLDASLSDLVAAGTFQERERRTVLGRECQVYRTGSSLESYTTTAPTDSTYTDACIDSSGLMLEELTVTNGKLAERVIATAVDDHTPPPASTFKITGTPTSLAKGGSDLTKIDAAKAPTVGYWQLDKPPAGYKLEARYSLQAPAADSSSTSATTTTTLPGQQPQINQSFVDVYSSGTKMFIVQQGATAGEPTNDASNGASTTVGKLGAAKVASSLTGSELVAHPSNPVSWYVHVDGTVPMATLKSIAASLHQ
jgi:hypothetical protein